MRSLLIFLLTSCCFLSQNLVAAPVAFWDFGTEEVAPVRVSGNVKRDQPGPRPPEFPDMADNNTAIRVSSGYLAIEDPGADSEFDFTNGDAITIEAWVNPDNLRDASPRYIIGKGRTGSPNFSRDNQNWALRLVAERGEVKLSFLFATKLSSDGKHWHRWTSQVGFPMSTGWHHVAVSYRFGDPKSIKGWINGKPTDGVWDMSGATTEPPVVDDDEIRIGTSFDGLLDEIAIYRETFTDDVIAKRFNRVGEPRVVQLQKEVMPEIANVPENEVLFQICEGLPTFDRWLYEGEQWPKESLRWTGDAFLLSRLPLQYDAWGIRTGWNAPLLLRMVADVDLPAGEHQLLMRCRGMGRLWIDGEKVASTKPDTRRPPDGEEPVTPVAEPPVPGLRAHGYHQQEALGQVTIQSDGGQPQKRCRVVLELVVGASGRRTETGEVCVAVRTEDGQTFNVVSANGQLPLTDPAVEDELEQIEQSLSQLDDQRRRQLAASQDEFWNRRHEFARGWADQNPLPPVPHSNRGESHPVDAFIDHKIETALTAPTGADAEYAKHFHGEVLPILREHCFRCHGEKIKGGLKLDSRTAALKGGDSEVPAIIPGNLDESELIVRIREKDEFLRMPPTEEGLPPAQVTTLEEWVRDGAKWPSQPIAESEVAYSPRIDDEAFLRRIYLDLVGVPAAADEALTFLQDQSPDKRTQLIDRLLKDDRFADQWMSFWLDLLAENPSLLNASLNSTGPFRWFLYDSLRDDKPLDQMVTELLLLRGGAAEGGSAGFGLAGENDAPMAAKGHILASAFLGIELQCARCHDSPYHSTTQKDLYSLAAMMNRKPLAVPKTSSVPAGFFENQKVRESLIQVTLSPGNPVPPEWPFAEVTGVQNDESIDQLMASPSDTRERLATLITAPQNERFSRVIVNRIWKQLMGVAFLEPIYDWEGNRASHPELLDWLAYELISHNYDLKHVIKLIVTSNSYQREAVGQNLAQPAETRFFNAPERRRLSAEQIVDALHHATAKPIDVEELTFVHDGRRPLGARQTLGTPTRAWMFGDLKNERDRPSLSLPKARAVVDVLEAFGWTGARQMPITERETDPNVLQPGVLSNGVLATNLTRASHGSSLADWAVQANSPQALVQKLFLQTLNRLPTKEEQADFASVLATGFEDRLVPEDQIVEPEPLPPLPQVDWFNHLKPRANEIQLEHEERVRKGPPADPRLKPEWRARYEDVVWSLINHREFVWMP